LGTAGRKVRKSFFGSFFSKKELLASASSKQRGFVKI
jgi:hypothetical protein